MTQAAQFTGYLVGAKGNTGRGISSVYQNADYTITIILTDGTSVTTAPIPGFTEIELDENYDLVVTKTDGTEETVETDLGTYRSTLEGYKTSAETSASSAATSASSAATSASAADTSASSAATSESSAAASASSAFTSASSAATSATSANTYAGQASSHATSAATSASSAAVSASSADAFRLIAEGYAVGKQNGTTQTSGSYYHYNAQYFNSQATVAASYAITASSNAATSATSAATSASSAADSATAAGSYAASIDPENMAGVIAYNKSATYPADTVGKALQDKPDADGTIANAEQLTSNIYEEDSVPYNFRTSGGSIDIGDRETDMVVGGTVAWNQLIYVPYADASKTENGVTIVDNRDGSYTVSTASGGATADTSLNLNSFPMNGKYIFTGCPKGGSASTYRITDLWTGAIDTGNGKIGDRNGSMQLAIKVSSGTVITTPIKFYPQAISLTSLFGSTIADYIYSLEQATAGAGVAFFRKLFPKPYYAYNAGELMSVNTSAHNTVGFNQWDEVAEYGGINSTDGENITSSTTQRSANFIPVLPNTTYYLKSAQKLYYRFYDADKNYIGQRDANNLASGYNTTMVTPTSCAYFRFVTDTAIASGSICINLSWDGERDGEYEAYVKHSYPLDSSLTLRGIPKLDASNNLYYDGDTYESDGTVTRRYGNLVLNGSNSEDWTYNTSAGSTTLFTLTLSDALNLPNNLDTNIRCAGTRFAPTTAPALVGDMSVPWKMALISSKRVMFSIPSTEASTVANMRTWLSSHNVELIYEKATPTTETADPYTNPQIVNDFGTEEYVDYAVSQSTRDVAIPVGHETQYMANLKAKLEMSPNSPEGAGDYIVRQTNGENEYVTLASNATIQNIIARLEALENAES